MALFQVSQNGIDAMTYLVDRMAVDFRPYISTVLPPIIDRLGESVCVHLALWIGLDLSFNRSIKWTLQFVPLYVVKIVDFIPVLWAFLILFIYHILHY
jgi:hypothetical protein